MPNLLDDSYTTEVISKNPRHINWERHMSKVETRFDTKIALAVANAVYPKKVMLKLQKLITANVNQQNVGT